MQGFKRVLDVKGIQVKFFALDQNVGICLKCILTKFEVSTHSRFQDIAVWIQPFSTSRYFGVAISSVLWQKINFEKAGLHLLKNS